MKESNNEKRERKKKEGKKVRRKENKKLRNRVYLFLRAEQRSI